MEIVLNPQGENIKMKSMTRRWVKVYVNQPLFLWVNEAQGRRQGRAAYSNGGRKKRVAVICTDCAYVNVATLLPETALATLIGCIRIQILTTKWSKCFLFSLFFSVGNFKFRLKEEQEEQEEEETLTSCGQGRDGGRSKLLANEGDVVDTNMRDVSANHTEERLQRASKDNGSCSSSASISASGPFQLLQSSDEFVEQQQQQRRRQLGNHCASLLSPFHLKTEPELLQPEQREQEGELEEQHQAEAETETEQQELTLYEHFRDANAKDMHDLEQCLKLQEQNGE